jgi:hypothetical protein
MKINIFIVITSLFVFLTLAFAKDEKEFFTSNPVQEENVVIAEEEIETVDFGDEDSYYMDMWYEYTFQGNSETVWIPVDTNCPDLLDFSATMDGDMPFNLLGGAYYKEVWVYGEYRTEAHYANLTVSSGGCVPYTRSCFISQLCTYTTSIWDLTCPF